MPFTISHVVAILPLTTGRSGRVLVPGALAIGAMVPDLPYFVPPHVGADWSHSALGPITTDLAGGVLIYALWHFLLVRPLTDLAPRWLATRLPGRPELTARRWLAVAGSVVIGSITHVVWDTFTHPDRWGTTHVGWLTTEAAGLPWYKWFQYGSGVVGLLILALWAVRWVYRTPPDRGAVRLSARRTRIICWAVAAVAAVGSAALTWLVTGQQSGDWWDEALAVRVATRTIALTTSTVVSLCLCWQIDQHPADRRSSRS